MELKNVPREIIQVNATEHQRLVAALTTTQTPFGRRLMSTKEEIYFWVKAKTCCQKPIRISTGRKRSMI